MRTIRNVHYNNSIVLPAPRTRYIQCVFENVFVDFKGAKYTQFEHCAFDGASGNFPPPERCKFILCSFVNGESPHADPGPQPEDHAGYTLRAIDAIIDLLRMEDSS